MAVKVTMYMEQGKATWSEAHYYIPATNPVDASDAAVALAGFRGACLGRNAYLVALRLSSFPANRVVYDIAFSPLNDTGTWPADPSGGNWSSDQANACLKVRMWGGVAAKTLNLAGVPDNVILTGPAYPDGYALGVDFDMVFDAYMSYLVAPLGSSNWGFRTRLSEFPAQVVGLVSNALYPQMLGVVVGSALVSVAHPGHNLGVGEEVYLSGWRRRNTRVPGLEGAYEVLGVLPPAAPPAVQNYTYFLANTGSVDPLNFLGLGTVDVLDYMVTPYARWGISKAGTRKRGGSFGLPVGRSPTRR